MKKIGSFSVLPPPPDACQVCAVHHSPEQPHNAKSMYYIFTFAAEHDNKGPSWGDAIAHCSPEMQEKWKEALRLKGVKEEEFIPTPKPNEDELSKQ